MSDQLCINTIRALAIDAIQAANSGHPGAPLGMAPIAYSLYSRYLRHNPANPAFPNRDRFVLSAGHASMLLYATLHLSGYDISLDDIRQFRQLGSKTPGHPEYGLTPGVETTTGPLGQGAANSVGMAIAERWLAMTFNRPGHTVVDYRVFALLGDGCMMEGITSEAASLAGHLQLSNLVWVYDNNHISIDGSTQLAFTEDVAKRFEAYNWQVLHVSDANDCVAFGKAVEETIAEADKPVLIITDSIIGYGSPNRAGLAKAHGEPLGDEEVAATKKELGLDPEKCFDVPDEVADYFTHRTKERGARIELEWTERYNAWAKDHPDLAEQFQQIQKGELPADWNKGIPTFEADAKGVASRAAGGKVMQAVASGIPWLVGGSADLAPSNKTYLSESDDIQAGHWKNNNIRFGVREHAMNAICNGLALSGLRSFGATFLVFSDYGRHSIRLSALMKLPVTWVFTHDSIAVGEDGPTHQPIEHVASLRLIPNLDVVRPCDANETAEAWKYAMERKTGPTVLVLTRQNLPTLDRTKYAPAAELHKGGYVLSDCEGTPDVILISTGSEVSLCLEAAQVLSGEGMKVRIVSMPCVDQFQRQDAGYRQSVLPPECEKRIVVEAGIPDAWAAYAGDHGKVIGISTFGESGPAGDVMKHFGLTCEAVVAAVKSL